MGKKIAIATSNIHKVRELEQVLSKCSISLQQVDIPKVEIQSNDLQLVAINAAITAYNALRKPVIVEDAGLFIEALSGFPGSYSSYVYRTIGINGILKLLEGVDDRRAYFESVIALAYNKGVISVRGRVYGSIATKPRGSGGFGFDPIFIPDGSTRTFAEMSLEEKNSYSHRGRAARELCRVIESVEIG